jgi:hypothetical protein
MQVATSTCTTVLFQYLLAPSSKQSSHEGGRQLRPSQDIHSAEGEPTAKKRKVKDLSKQGGTGEASVLLLLTPPGGHAGLADVLAYSLNS